MKFLLLSDHLSPFFDGWSSDKNGFASIILKCPERNALIKPAIIPCNY